MADPSAKKTKTSPPKRFKIPPDLYPLQSSANTIIAQMRSAHHWRMTQGISLIASGRGIISKRGKPAQKKR